MIYKTGPSPFEIHKRNREHQEALEYFFKRQEPTTELVNICGDIFSKNDAESLIFMFELLKEYSWDSTVKFKWKVFDFYEALLNYNLIRRPSCSTFYPSNKFWKMLESYNTQGKSAIYSPITPGP